MQLLSAHKKSVLRVAFSPDGRYLASGSYDGTARLWQLPETKACSHIVHGHAVSNLSFAPDSSVLLVSGQGSSMHFVFLDPRQLLSLLPRDFGGWRTTYGVPDGVPSCLVPNDRHPGLVVVDYQSTVRALALRPDRRGGIARHKEDILLAHPPNVVESQKFGFGSRNRITTFRFSPDGSRLAVGGMHELVLLIEVRPEEIAGPSGRYFGEPSVLAHEDSEGCRDPAFSPDGEWLALALLRGPEIWDVKSQTVAQRLPAHQGPTTCVAFTPDGEHLLSAGADGVVSQWSTTTWERERTYDWDMGRIHSLAISPDGMLAALGAESAEILVWDLDE